MALEILFKSDVGLLSLFTILFVLGIGAYFFLFLRARIREEDRKKKRA